MAARADSTSKFIKKLLAPIPRGRCGIGCATCVVRCMASYVVRDVHSEQLQKLLDERDASPGRAFELGPQIEEAQRAIERAETVLDEQWAGRPPVHAVGRAA